MFHPGSRDTMHTNRTTLHSINAEGELKLTQTVPSAQDASTPQNVADLHANKSLQLGTFPRQHPTAREPKRIDQAVALPTSNDPTVCGGSIAQLDMQKCPISTDMYIDVLSNDQFGCDNDETETNINKENSMKRISCGYQKLDRRTMEPKHNRLDDFPIDRLGYDTGVLVTSEAHHARRSSKEKSISREYQKLDKRTMESKHDTSHDITTADMSIDKDANETYHTWRSAAEKGVSKEYQKLDRRTMEPRHETSDALASDHLGNWRDTSGKCLDCGNSTGKRMSREYQKLDRRTMESKHDKFDDMPADYLNKDKDANGEHLDSVSSAGKTMSWEYQTLDKGTTEHRQETPDELPSNRLGNDRDGGEAYRDRRCLADDTKN